MAFSRQYLRNLRALHKEHNFGSGKKLDKALKKVLDTGKVKSLLDFGCGQGYMSDTIRKEYPDIKLYSYDPVTNPILLPDKVDMIISSDVLEHIEPELLQETLEDLFNRVTKYQYHLIACHPAKKILQDGRNAHLIVEQPKWWKKKLGQFRWKISHENIKERYVEKYDLNIVKYITVIKK